MKANEITVIRDNAGGLILQAGGYQHIYYDGDTAARDVVRILGGENLQREWENYGYEEKDDWGNPLWIIPSREELKNGCYKVYTVADLLVAETADLSGYTLREFSQEMQRRY
jgi:hypothetical protein